MPGGRIYAGVGWSSIGLITQMLGVRIPAPPPGDMLRFGYAEIRSNHRRLSSPANSVVQRR